MSKPKPATPWQATLPDALPLYMKRNIAPESDGCWEWTRSLDRDGYGWASLHHKTYLAHRLVYRLIRDVNLDGVILDHLCRRRSCVNPDHLEPVTNVENLRRSPIVPIGQENCLRCGGEFTVVGRTQKQRRCLRCKTDWQRGYRPEFRRGERRRSAAK